MAIAYAPTQESMLAHQVRAGFFSGEISSFGIEPSALLYTHTEGRGHTYIRVSEREHLDIMNAISKNVILRNYSSREIKKLSREVKRYAEAKAKLNHYLKQN